MTYALNNADGLGSDNVAEEHNSRLGSSEIFRIIRRHLALIALIVVGGMAGTAFWLASQGPNYVASAAILLRNLELPSETIATVTDDGVVSSTQVFTEVEVLRSREFASRLARALGLMSDPAFNPALVEPDPPSWLDRILFRLGLSSPEEPEDIAPQRQHAEVTEKLLELYNVTASSQHNVIEISAHYSDPALVAQIANETARLYIDMQTDEQLTKLDRDIQYMRRRSEEITASLSRQQANLTRLMLESQLLDEDAMRTLIAEQNRLRTRLETSAVDESAREDLQTRINQIDVELERRVGAQLRLDEGRTALETEATRLDSVKKRLDELQALRDSPNPNVEQISFAEVPSEPAGPNIKSTLAVAFVILTLLGIVAAMLRESLDDRVLHQEHAESLTGLNVLASLTRIPRKLLRRHRAPHLCLASQAAPGYSNAVRALVSAAMEDAEPGRAPIVFIGSAKSGEGKSTVVSSMAVAAALDDLRVLVIDFDVHRFGVTKTFGMRRGQFAFSEVLANRKTFEQAVKPTGQAGIELLNFRPGSNMSRRAFWPESAQDIIAAMRQDYDLVLIDTPPFLASEEAGRLHEIVDKAILVSGWGESRRGTLVQTARLMRRSGLPVIGIAINGVTARSAQAYGYLAFRDDYYQAKDASKV